ncbi:MAG: GNAT family N-acetyltransferase [Candidatus Binatia bacterium]
MQGARQGRVGTRADVVVRPLRERELPAADHIMRLAFGTFIGLPEPASFMGDADYVRGRWLADPAAAFGGELDGQLVGSNFATNWGSFAFFGPLTVHPDFWNRGIAGRLMEPVIALFDQWQVRDAGLFTFAESPKHISLYQKFGFRPRFLTAVMAKPVAARASGPQWSRFSQIPQGERSEALDACRAVADSVYEGLDVTREIQAIAAQELGDTVLLWDAARLAGFATCHCAAGSEAGSNTCYVKFAAVRSGLHAGEDFDRMVGACETLAAQQDMGRLVVGVNTARREAYETLLARGFRIELTGVAMQRSSEPGFNRSGVYVIDDWR